MEWRNVCSVRAGRQRQSERSTSVVGADRWSTSPRSARPVPPGTDAASATHTGVRAGRAARGGAPALDMIIASDAFQRPPEAGRGVAVIQVAVPVGAQAMGIPPSSPPRGLPPELIAAQVSYQADGDCLEASDPCQCRRRRE